jgi:hypothetical protein
MLGGNVPDVDGEKRNIKEGDGTLYIPKNHLAL